MTDSLHVVCVFYSDEHCVTLTEPMLYFDARDIWLQHTHEGQKYVTKTSKQWFKIIPAKNAPPRIEKRSRKKK